MSAVEGGEAEERRRLKIVRLVAESWRDAAIEWGSLQMDGRTTAHPLALVLCALDGETDPIELGISPTDPAWDAIKAAASDDETRPDAPPSGEYGRDSTRKGPA
jgi:hypothetical protein